MYLLFIFCLVGETLGKIYITSSCDSILMGG